MKKLLFLFVLLVGKNMEAQIIPNGNFENWSNGDPVNWITYNSIYSFLGLTSPPVVSVSPAPEGDFAVKMTALTNVNTGEVFPGFCYLGNMDLMTGAGSIGIPFSSLGIPYADMPSTFSGKFQHFTSSASDTAIIGCVFTRWDPVMSAQIAVGAASFVTTQDVGTWTDFAVPLVDNATGDPDTMSIFLFANGSSGSSLSVDQLGFGGVSSVLESSVGKSDVLLFPNPAVEEVWIESSRFGNQPIQVNIYNMNGESISKCAWSNGGLRKLEVLNWLPGKYIVEMVSKNEKVVKTFVKR